MSVLEEIVARKKLEVQELHSFHDIADMRKKALCYPASRDLAEAVRNCDKVPVIAEVKKKSPSRGSIDKEVNVEARAKLYEESGAVAVSVLTDQKSFGGHITDLEACASVLSIPVLRKDFIVDEIQLYQSKLAGADAILLIAAALSPDQYARLLYTTLELEMTPLTEVHNLEELESVLPAKPPVVGINNRNLHTLKVDTDVTRQLIGTVPKGTVAISESGIEDPSEIQDLIKEGVHGFLVGTALMTSKDPKSLLKRMCG